MPFTKINTSEESKNYLNKFLEIKDDVLSNYIKNIDKIHFSAPGWDGRLPQPVIKGWRMCYFFSNQDTSGRERNINLFNNIKEVCENVPENVHIIGSSILEAFPNIEESWHEELHPVEQGFKRYHIPLQVNDNYSLEVIENDNRIHKYNWEVGSVFNFENPGNSHQVSHSGDSDDESRIVWIIDLLENDELTPEQIQHTKNHSWTISSNGMLWDEECIK